MKWIEYLNEDELELIFKFIVYSGSLKKLALEYKVTYPTIRLKLDRLIQKIGIAKENESRSSFEDFVESELKRAAATIIAEAKKRQA